MQMRYTRQVSVWPVGLAGYLRYESPVLDSQDGHVIGWFTAWKPKREYAIDMAGFAVNVRLVVEQPTAGFSYSVARGEQETYFIRQLISGLSELEPRANNCTEVPFDV
jgi:galactosylgalactosylxylosylprotein 3-beta-glucuronosyltransferase 3